MENCVNAPGTSGISADYFCGTGRKNLGMHRHNNSEALFVLEGHLNFLCADDIYNCSGCCLIFFREKKLHTTDVDPSKLYRRYNLNFRYGDISDCIDYDDVRDILEPDCRILAVNSEKDKTELLSLFESLCSLSDKCGTVYDGMRKNLTALILAKASLMGKDSGHRNDCVVQSYITDVIRYITDNLDKKLVISDIAGVFFVSRAKLICDFKAATGITIGELITAKRIKKAKTLLKQGVSVSAAAGECGFSNTCHFIRTFKKTTGTTPLKYSRGDI